MKSVYKLNQSNCSELVNKCSQQLLKEGSFILIPTETVYGLACLWQDIKAKNNIYKAKERPENKPFQLLISNIDMLKQTNAIVSDITLKIINEFCPGPITIVVPSTDNNKIGFRIPEHSFVLNLINKVSFPFAATSANISGSPAALDINSALKALKLKPDLCIDGGDLPKDSLSSTVIEITDNDDIKLLREGPIPLSDIIEFI